MKKRKKKSKADLKSILVSQVDAVKKQNDLKEKEPSNDSSFDFGGIPARDLKRNLGCG